MSFIPKISVGVSNKKATFDLGQDTHTTAEIGYIQPTFCRDIVPGSHVEISSRNLIRLSPLAVPCMGRMSLKNYYYFVDMSTLWTPFDAFRKGTNYVYGDGTVATPTYAPTFSLENVFIELFRYGNGLSDSQNLRELKESIYACVYDQSTGELLDDTASDFDIDDYFPNDSLHHYAQMPLVIKLKSGLYVKTNSGYSSSSSDTARLGNHAKYIDVTNQNADFSFINSVNGKNCSILGRFMGASKRLRKIFIGTGYSFNPGDQSEVSPFKLLAVYKAWFDTFAVQRTINFNNTNCYKVIKMMSEVVPDSAWSDMLSDFVSGDNDLWDFWIDFLADLSNICYNLPADYFSASDITAQRGALITNGLSSSDKFEVSSLTYGAGSTTSDVSASTSYQDSSHTYDTGYAQANDLAQRLLKWVNKRSVVGRKISELLKLDGEVDLHNNEHETVHHLGDDKIDINISDVMSLASTDDASLGDYAGRGLGMGNTDTFSYDAKAYGILLCLSTIVPQSGYFQGILRENYDKERFDFFTDEFDALGYQALDMRELVSDNQFKTGTVGSGYQPVDDGVFGLVPRYQHLKVGRNICNGDISLPSMQSVMLPYTLDRHFITRIPSTSNKWQFNTYTLPSNTPETFRQIRATEGYGDYNRIFQYVNGDYDHFILQMVFNCKLSAPMKSISESYDTFDKDVDDSTIAAAKQ